MIKQLEDIDKETVDNLFEAVNFETFKSLMVESRNAKVGNFDAENQANVGLLDEEGEIISKTLGTDFKQFMNNFNDDVKTWDLQMTTKEKDFAKKGYSA